MKKIILLSSLLCLHSFLFAQGVVVTGTVTDDTGEGLPGVNVVKKGTTIGTITDVNGAYQLEIEDPENSILVFSSVGFLSEEIAVGTQSSIDVVLTQDVTQLDEVVVSAFGIEREAKTLAYARQGVDKEGMVEARSANFINALSGRAAGVQVVNGSTPTGSNRVVIRGITSVTGNNQPLYVVDGVPLGDEQGDINMDVRGGTNNIDYGSPISHINPDDIESLEVLKGANAAALYGSRASNGVILITTKKGVKSEGLGITINSNTQFTQNSEYPHYQYVYGHGRSGRIVNSTKSFDSETGWPIMGDRRRSLGIPMLGFDIIAWNGEPDVYTPRPDNVKNMYQTGYLLTNGVSLDKANESGSFRLSYTNTQGEFTIDNFEKQMRHNLTFRGLQNFGKSLKADVGILYTNDKVKNRIYKNGSSRNPANGYMYMIANMDESNLNPYKDENGMAFGYDGSFVNPYWNLYENSNQDESNRIILNAGLTWEIMEGLSLRGKAMGDVNMTTGEVFENFGADYDNDGSYRVFDRTRQNWNYEALLQYDKTFSNFSVVAMAGANRYDRIETRRQSSIDALLVPDVKSLANSNTIPQVVERDLRKRVNSVFGSLSVGYNGFVYLDATARNDWSSTLPSDNNSYFYPSIGTSVIFSEFIPENNVLSFGKIRASYAEVGNDTDPYNILTTLGYQGIYNGIAWLALDETRNNPYLKPELTSSTEFGLELSFLRNRLTLNGTYYQSSTINQIIPAQVTTTTGYARQIFNAGEIANEGWELFASGKALAGKFTWNIDLNWSMNETLVVSLLDEVDNLLLRSDSNLKVWARVGEPLGYMTARVMAKDPETGVNLIQSNGRVRRLNDEYVGNAQPDWIGGLRNSFSFKGFNLSALIDVKMGGDLYSGTYVKTTNHGMHADVLYGADEYFFSRRILNESNDELQGEGLDDTDYLDADRMKGPYFDNAAIGIQNEDGIWEAERDADGNIIYRTYYLDVQPYQSDIANDYNRSVFDASYVKLREVVFGYDIPSNIVSKIHFQSARVSLVGRNLWTMYRNTPWGIDPESNTTSGNGQGIEYGALLPTRSYGFNIRLSF
jgi:TonB-linked SusC/RagA family outer membrane protein